MYSLALSPDQIDEEMAKAIVDEYRSPSSIMDPAIINRIMELVGNDIERLNIIHTIVSNTILYCDIILLPDLENPFSQELRSLAASVIDRHRDMLDRITKDLNQ